MLEFSGMLFMQRINMINEGTNVCERFYFRRRGSFEMHKLSAKIDGVAFISIYCFIFFSMLDSGLVA